MSTLTTYIDTSTKSLIIAGMVFLVVVFFTKYALDSSESDTPVENRRSGYLTILYAIVLGLIFGTLALVLCKQFGKFGACDILTDPYPR